MTARPDSGLSSVFRSSSRWTGAIVAIGCALLAVLRLSGPAAATDSFWAPVRVTTTLALILAGVSLCLAGAPDRSRRRFVGRLCAAVVIVVGVVLLAAWILSPDSVALFPPLNLPLGPLTPLAAERMAPNTALSLALLGGALLLLDVETRRAQRPSQFLAVATALISLLAVIGYVYGLAPFYRIGLATAMPRHVAVAFLALSAGVLFARPERGIMRVAASETGGGLLMCWLPAAVFGVPLLFGWLTLTGQRAGFYGLDFGISVFVILNTVFFSLLILWTASSLDRSDRRRSRAEDELRVRASQQAGVAELSQHALSGADPGTLMNEAVTLVVNTLETQVCELLEIDAERALVFRAGAGWENPDIDRPVADVSTRHLYGYTLTCREPVIVTDLSEDSRFTVRPDRLEGIVSGLSVILHGRTGPAGILAAYSRERRTFTKDDILFLQTVAAVLASATDRERADEALRRSDEKFGSLFRSCPDSIIVCALNDGRFIDVNESFLRITGYTREEVVGQTAAELQFWVDADTAQALIDQVREDDTVSNREASFKTKDGHARVGLFAAEIVTLADGPCLLAAIRDISERKRVEAEMQDANAKLGRWVNELESRTHEISLLNEMGDLLQSCLTPPEAHGIIVQYAQQLFPNDSGALCMLNASNDLVEAVAVWGEVAQEDLFFAPTECWALRRGRLHRVADPASGLVCPHLKDAPEGAYLCVPMMAQGEALGVLCLRETLVAAERSDASLEHLTESKQRLAVTVAEHFALALANLKLRETLRTQSIRDQLTGLFNRRYMEESLERELRRAARTRRKVGLILLDLDHFKDVNDTFGHEAGDKLLRAVGQFIQSRTREEDIACRYGGEEFVFVLPEANLEATRQRAEQVREEVKRLEVPYRGNTLPPLSISLGIAVYPDHGTTAASLLRTADAALYRAKTDGRDRLVVAKAAD